MQKITQVRAIKVKTIVRQGTSIKFDGKGQVVTNGFVNPHVRISKEGRQH